MTRLAKRPSNVVQLGCPNCTEAFQRCEHGNSEQPGNSNNNCESATEVNECWEKTAARDNVVAFLFAPTGQPAPKNGHRKRRVYSRARGSRKLGRVRKGRKGTFASEYHAVLNVRHGWNSFDTPAATSASPATRHRSPRMCRYNPRFYALHTRDPHVQTSE